jgi:hypothetical protein
MLFRTEIKMVKCIAVAALALALADSANQRAISVIIAVSILITTEGRS